VNELISIALACLVVPSLLIFGLFAWYRKYPQASSDKTGGLMFEFIDWWIRFTWRSFIWGAHGALIAAAVGTIALFRERNYWSALTFGLFTVFLAIFLIAWWRGKVFMSNTEHEK
jgi:hypothetical protein